MVHAAAACQGVLWEASLPEVPVAVARQADLSAYQAVSPFPAAWAELQAVLWEPFRAAHLAEGLLADRVVASLAEPFLAAVHEASCVEADLVEATCREAPFLEEVRREVLSAAFLEADHDLERGFLLEAELLAVDRASLAVVQEEVLDQAKGLTLE